MQATVREPFTMPHVETVANRTDTSHLHLITYHQNIKTVRRFWIIGECYNFPSYKSDSI